MIKTCQPSELLFIQITDSHLFTNEDGEFSEVNSYDSLKAILQHIQLNFPAFDGLIATGDLVQETEPAAYHLLLDLLKKVDAPVFCLPGNHDSPELMNQLLNTDNVHTDQQTGFNDWDIYFLNSHKPSSHSGFLPKAELEALDHKLTYSTGSHALICIHHHPVSINSSWMDSMILENPDELFAVLDKYDHIRGIIWGHIHQEFSQIRNGVLLMGTPSTCAQFSPGVAQYQRDHNSGPGYRWLILKEDGKIDTGVKRI